VLLVIGIVLAVILLWLIAVPVIAWSQISRVDAEPAGDRPADQPGTTFLLVGSDSREGLTAEDRKRLGTGNSGGQRTDTIMILSIPPGGRPALISVPRDSYVTIPGRGENKINAAYAFGGPELLVETVEQNTGLRIDAYTEIGFGGFVNVIDALGGIQMCLPRAIKDRDSHLDLPKGCQVLDGTNALGYVRMRKADPRGDLGRVERQRQMLAAVAKEAASPLTVINPVRYWSLLTSSAQAVAIGQDTNFGEMVGMANAMRQVAGGTGLTLTVPIADADASTPVGSAVLWDEEKAEEMFGDIARGDTGDLDKFVN
jgi:LCP family protein required for cell wall assembly